MLVDERLPVPRNPLGIDGVEFIEFATSQPLALGALLEKMGFVLVARHRSREVLLYRQGTMNLVVNAHPDALPGMAAPGAVPTIAAFALRVGDAATAYRQALALGAWAMPTRAAAMELNIPGIRGVGDSLIHFVDSGSHFSIYDVDFIRVDGVDPSPPAVAGLHWFGLVQSVHADRRDDWSDFYCALFGFSPLPEGRFFGILPKGTLLQSPCRNFCLQLIEPPEGSEDTIWEEGLLRIGLGTPDVPAAVSELARRGIKFVDHGQVQPSDRGALTQLYLGGVCFELVASHPRSC